MESHADIASTNAEAPAIDRAESRADQPLWRLLVGYLGGAFLGAILVFGAFSKALDPHAFEEQIVREGLDFLLPASAVALIAFALEAGLGGALLVGIRRLWVLVPSAALVAFFLGLTGRSYYRYTQGIIDEGDSCGCFGNLVQRTPAEAFWQDAALMVPALLLAFVGWRFSRRATPLRAGIVSALTVGTLLLAWKAPELPLDDIATQLKPGRAVSDFCAGADDQRICLGSLVPELLEGEHLVILADLEDASFGEAVPALNEFQFAGKSVLVLADATPEQQHTFFWQWGPAFEIHEVPAAILKPMYRTLPRSFRTSDGVVTQTIAGLPELPEVPEPADVPPPVGSDPTSSGL